MSCDKNIAIKGVEITKRYPLYDKPWKRLRAILSNKSKPDSQQFTALDAVSFSIMKGTTVGIIGENGSGKSTLLQIISGIIVADSGQVEINGRIAALLELGAGFNPEFTGKENVFMNAALLGLSLQETEEKYDDIVRFSEIGEFIDRPVKTYSSGMFVRLAFAVAINVHPDILIIDEALAVGDAKFQSKCFNKIQKLKEMGATILFVSHDISSIRRFCDRAIWLEKGQIKMDGDVLHISSKYMEFLFQNPEDTAKVSFGTNGYDTIDSDQPVNHWGNNIGSILSCYLLDAGGKRKKLFRDDESITVRMHFKIPEKANYEGFGVAFAIRALNGSDLIVYDTFGQDIKFEQNQREYEVNFTFSNPLNVGEYMLVAVLEDRTSITPSYYEFIEGVEFFSIMRSKQYFGHFITSVNMSVTNLIDT